MSNFEKGLVEAEKLLNELDEEYKRKIPQRFWRYIEKNKDQNYYFDIDFNKYLDEQNILPETVAILTYVNMEYLLEDEPKQLFKDLLREDEKESEFEKAKKYNIDIFEHASTKNNVSDTSNITTVPIAINEKWYTKLFNKIKAIFN